MFKFIGAKKIARLLETLPFLSPAFMNTQLFFDPLNPAKKNYWYRDPQYHLNLMQQQSSLAGPEVIHFRIALRDEPGIELVPGSHRRWDSPEELNVRLEREGRHRHEPISTGHQIALNKGDLLIFSANMIHRGLYGQNRLSLDILFCELDADLINFVDDISLPSKRVLEQVENGCVFENVMRLKGLMCG